MDASYTEVGGEKYVFLTTASEIIVEKLNLVIIFSPNASQAYREIATCSNDLLIVHTS